MAEDADPAPINGKLRLHEARQFFRDVGIHAIAARPRSLRRIDIEAGAGAEIVALVLPGDLQAARARVRDDDREAELGGDALRARLDDEILLCAGEAGEPVEHRHRSRACGGRNTPKRITQAASRDSWL